MILDFVLGIFYSRGGQPLDIKRGLFGTRDMDGHDQVINETEG